MPSRTLTIRPGTKQHTKIVSMLDTRVKLARKAHSNQAPKWRDAEERLLAYVPESEVDNIRRGRRENLGKQDYTTIQVPYSYAIVMTAHTYLTSVFFARSPIHQFQGRHGESEMNIMATEALISYQTQIGLMAPMYYIWLYDVLKYGAGIFGEHWENETIQYSQLEEDPEGGGSMLNTYQVPGYQGNKIYNVSPLKFMHDPRVTLGEYQRGEFCIVEKDIPWNELVRKQAQGWVTNLDAVSSNGRNTRNTEEQGSSRLERPLENVELESGDLHSSDGRRRHPPILFCYEIYIELVPNEWGLSSSTYPEKWCFTVTQDMAVIIGACPLGYIHGKFPFTIAEVEIEAYGRYNRGFPEIMQGLQQTIDWLVNSHFYNVRAALNNQFVVDPSRIYLKDAERGGPGLMFRLRPEAYGTDPKQALHQLQVADVTGRHMNDVGGMFSIGERVLGVNDQLMGLLEGGGRKTATEVRTATGFGVNRLKTIAEYHSITAVAPHTQRLVQNSQQYYSGEKRLRIVGDTAQFSNQRFVQVTPEDIAGFYDYIPVDGTLPVDWFALATIWKEIMTQSAQVPEIAATMDWFKMLGYVAQILGVKNFNQFRRVDTQVVPDEQLARDAEAGNVVPLRPVAAPDDMESPGDTSAATGAGVNAMTSRVNY